MESKNLNQKLGRKRTVEYPSRESFNTLRKLYPDWSILKIFGELNPNLSKQQCFYLIRKWNEENLAKKKVETHIVVEGGKDGLLVSNNDPNKDQYSIENKNIDILEKTPEVTETLLLGEPTEKSKKLLNEITSHNVDKWMYLESKFNILKTEEKIKLLTKFSKEFNSGVSDDKTLFKVFKLLGL